MKKVILIAALAAFLTGCAGFMPGDSDRVGSYQYSVSADGVVTVDSRTLKGGPDVEVITAEGVKTTITSSREQVINGLIELAK